MLEHTESTDDLGDAAAHLQNIDAHLENFNGKDDSGTDSGDVDNNLTDGATALSKLWKLGECLESQGEMQQVFELDESCKSPGPLNLGEVASEARAQALRALRKRRGRDSEQGFETEKRHPSVSPAGSSAASQTDEMTLMAESLITFGKQLKTLQEHQVQQDEIHQDYMRKIINKLDAMQNLCNDTATMGMQHAQAVLGIGLRIEVLENQVGHVLDEKASPDSPSPASSSTIALSEFSKEFSKVNANSNSAPVEPSAGSSTPGVSACSNSTCKAHTDFQQQYAETALKVFGQVSSIETRVSKLEESIAAEVKHALSDLGISHAIKDAVQKPFVALHDVIQAGNMTNQALTRLTQISQSSVHGSSVTLGNASLQLKSQRHTNSSNGISYTNNLLSGSQDRHATLQKSESPLPAGGSVRLKRELVSLEDGIPEHSSLNHGLSRSLHSLSSTVQTLKPADHNEMQQLVPSTSTQAMLGPKLSPQVSSQVKRVQLSPQGKLFAPDRPSVVREQSAPSSRVQRLLSQPVLPSDIDSFRQSLDFQTPRMISGMGSAGSPPLSSRQTIQVSTPQSTSRQLSSPKLCSRQLASPQLSSRHSDSGRVAVVSGGKSPVPPMVSGGKSPVPFFVKAVASVGTPPKKSPPSTPVTGWRNVATATAIMPTRITPGTVNQIESI